VATTRTGAVGELDDQRDDDPQQDDPMNRLPRLSAKWTPSRAPVRLHAAIPSPSSHRTLPSAANANARSASPKPGPGPATRHLELACGEAALRTRGPLAGRRAHRSRNSVAALWPTRRHPRARRTHAAEGSHRPIPDAGALPRKPRPVPGRDPGRGARQRFRNSSGISARHLSQESPRAQASPGSRGWPSVSQKKAEELSFCDCVVGVPTAR
jgi:hypothetical protein